MSSGYFGGGVIAGSILPDVTGRNLGSPTQKWNLFCNNLFFANFEDIRFADLFPASSVGAQIDAAVADLAGAQGLVFIASSMGPGWSLAGIPSNVTVLDCRGNGGSTQTAFVRGLDVYGRVTSVGTGLQIPSTLMLEHDAYSGGVNEYPGGAATKTQFQALRIEMHGRTIGERKGAEINVTATGKGDNIGIMASAYDLGGYSTGGDEGSEGGRFQTFQGDGSADGGFPRGTIAAVNGNTLTGTWTNGTNANLGEQRPLINTSRGVYSTGTLASGSGTAPFTIVGSGTSWSLLGTGAKTDLFLEYTAFSNGTVKHVIPITSIVDDTHLTAEYTVSEIGASSFNPSGAYNIFKGGKVASLAAPPSGSFNATAVNLVSGGANFQAGDSIQQPLGYNYHGAGVQVVVSSLLTPTAGSAGIKINNVGSVNFGDALFINGNFDNLIRTGSTFSDSIIKSSTPYGCFFKSSDTSAIVQAIVQVLNGSLQARNFSYDRPNDWWVLGGVYFNGSDQRFGIGTNPQANTLGYLYYNNANWQGLAIEPAQTPSNNSKPPLRVAVAGVPTFQVEKDRVVINNGMNLTGFSDNEATQKWTVAGSTGAASFNGGVTIGSGTAIIKTVVYSQTITPSSVNAATSAEQAFTVTGLTTADKVIVNPAPTGNATMVGASRVSGADTIAIQFTNPTAGSLTPGAGTYNIIAVRS